MMGLTTNWHSWSEFIHMGGYGLYVWGSFAMTGAVMLIETLQIRQRRRQLSAQGGKEST